MNRDLVSFFHKESSSFPSTISQRNCISSNVYFWQFCQKLAVCSHSVGWYKHSLLYPIGLYACFCVHTLLSVSLWLCRIIWDQVIWSPTMLFLLKIALDIHSIVCFNMNLFFWVLCEWHWKFYSYSNEYLGDFCNIFTILILYIHKHGQLFRDSKFLFSFIPR